MSNASVDGLSYRKRIVTRCFLGMALSFDLVLDREIPPTSIPLLTCDRALSWIGVKPCSRDQIIAEAGCVPAQTACPAIG
jgi:hypothetical protein